MQKKSKNLSKFNPNRVLIFGATGQDGSYLTELYLDRGIEVVGCARRNSTDNTQRIKHVLANNRFTLVECDITDFASVHSVISKYNPEIVFNLAAQSHVATSFHQPIHTLDVTGKGVLNILEAIRIHKDNGFPRFYQASSSEMFGDQFDREPTYSKLSRSIIAYNGKKYQDENTKMVPQSPYAIAKLVGHNLVNLYRQSYGMYCVSGILFNHESERRGENFVTRKVTKWIGRFKHWFDMQNVSYKDLVLTNNDVFPPGGEFMSTKCPKLRLGNLYAKRDWGHAKDYVRAMSLMMEQDKPEDYLVATGETHTVGEFVAEAFKCIGIDNWEDYVVIDDGLKRPAEVNYLCGSPNKIKTQLGWEPQIDFKELVKIMVEGDIKTNGDR